ncbi:MAG: polysaccharide biosynthesis protein [Candidatus Pacebacteria bacterium]|nr:polysaccharide biosynthesis protein [Candidatus Paceibacterota bacterium]
MKNEKIFITGGAGYLGRHVIKRFYENNEITVFSRDEAKHYYLKKQFPKIKCIIGDIRNFELLKKSMAGHTIGIFAASLKQIEAVDQNVEEAVQIIVNGALNSKKAAIENKLKAATFISSDKSRNATTLYGAMKFVGGEAFIVNAEKEVTKLSCVVYGNVINSTGSIIPLIWDSVKNNYSLKLYGNEMTRFMIEVERAVDAIETALNFTGFTVIPVQKAHKVKDLFEIYEEKFGLKWEEGSPRISEKTHEQTISPYETARTTYNKEYNVYLIHYSNIFNEIQFSNKGLTSEDCLMTKDELKNYLEENNYFDPR